MHSSNQSNSPEVPKKPNENPSEEIQKPVVPIKDPKIDPNEV